MHTSATDESTFVKIFGNYPQVKVLDFLIENDIFDYSKTQIADLSGVSFNTLETFWSRLVETGIVKVGRRVGNSQMYQLNKDNQVVKKLLEIDKKLMLLSMTDPVEEKPVTVSRKAMKVPA
jgi:DNA-binding transcriptional ArsR family regulator